MSRRGSHIGGHTVIGPGSEWFSKSKRRRPKRPQKPLVKPEIAEQQRSETQEEARIKRERVRQYQRSVAAKEAAKIAARYTVIGPTAMGVELRRYKPEAGKRLRQTQSPKKK